MTDTQALIGLLAALLTVLTIKDRRALMANPHAADIEQVPA